jgi:hypothetical protein
MPVFYIDSKWPHLLSSVLVMKTVADSELTLKSPATKFKIVKANP